MPTTIKRMRHFAAALLLVLTLPAMMAAAQDKDEAARTHIQALESAGQHTPDELVDLFDDEHFSEDYIADTAREERRDVLAEIADVAAQAGAAMIDVENDEFRLSLQGPNRLTVAFEVEDSPPFAISTLRVVGKGERVPPIELTWDNAEEVFDTLAQQGLSGVVSLTRNGRTVHEAAYGSSNEALGFDTQLDTIYGIGSTPIDFTVAGLFLLAEDGKLSLSDTIGKFFDDVPADKRGMTLSHLVSGQSGLPDFHDRPGDWDADLAWIDREEAVARILAQKLRFAPGDGDAHSHSAYGLVAAVVEKVSGQSYFDFMQQRIFQPAGMSRTGMYGDSGTFDLRGFAEGRGPSSVGIPNIPPNWGPTSWLVMGSGGMYSTLGDMQKFYAFVRAEGRFKPEHAERWSGEFVGIGGSDRGFYLFHALRGKQAEAMMLINGEGRSPEIQALSRALERLVMSGQ